MKNFALVLVMLLMAATSFSQPSRRTTNNTKPAGQEKRTNVNVNNKTKQDARKTTVGSQNKDSKDQRRTTGVRPDTRRGGQPDVRSGNKPDNKPGDRPGDKPGDQPRREYKSTGQQPVNNTGRPDLNNNREPRKNPPVVTTERHPVNVNRTAKGHPIQQGPNPPLPPKDRPVYHSTRKFIEPRPVRHHYVRPPRPREYRARRYPYRQPLGIHILWTNNMRLEYIRIYPEVKRWYYTVGYTIPTISAYDALYYTGEVMNVYGKVYEVFYSARTDEYYLYFGAYYPYNDFTVVLPGWIARRYSSYPESYFERQHIIVTGLISTFDDKPELVVKRESQINLY
jgi:hypothetical protein